ncbi:MAG: apolipoprotein N-acyltransferase [Armatimonadota bacterium]
MNIFKKTEFGLFWIILSLSMMLLAFPILGYSPFAWIALIPFILVIYNLNVRKIILYTILGGIWFCVFALSAYFKHMTGWVILTLVFSVNLTLFAVVAHYFYKITKPEEIFKRILFNASLYVFMVEYLTTAELFGIKLHMLAYSQYKILPVIQIADIFGSFGISFLIAFISIFLAEIINLYLNKESDKEKIKLSYFIIPVLLIILCLSYGFYKTGKDYTKGDKVKISAIQPDLTQKPAVCKKYRVKFYTEFLNNRIKKLLYLTGKTFKEEPDLTVWPEVAVPARLKLNKSISEPLNDFVNENGLNLLTGAVELGSGVIYNSVFLLEPGKGITGVHSKNTLFPLMEYNPLNCLLARCENNLSSFTPGNDRTIFDLNGIKFGVLICFESVNSNVARKLVLSGAQYFIIPADDGWFEKENILKQHIVEAVFRSIENRVYSVQAANTGYSAFIAPSGKIYRLSSVFTEDILTDYVYADEKESFTIFTNTGDIFVLICMVIALGIFILKKVKK